MCCRNSSLKQIPCSNPVHIMNRPYMFSTPRTNQSKVASILAYMCSRLRVTIHFVSSFPNLLTLYVQYTKTIAVKKRLPFELICAVYLEYIVTIHFVCPYPNLLTFYVQYTKTLAIKKWLPFEPICTVDLEYIVTIRFVRPYTKGRATSCCFA